MKYNYFEKLSLMCLFVLLKLLILEENLHDLEKLNVNGELITNHQEGKIRLSLPLRKLKII